MDNVVNFQTVKDGPPSPEFVIEGNKYHKEPDQFCYTVGYEHNGQQYGFQIWASSMEEAESKLESLKKNAIVEGQLYDTVEG